MIREGEAIGLVQMKSAAQRVGKRPVFDHLEFQENIEVEHESGDKI
jgi:hypothetical protein